MRTWEHVSQDRIASSVGGFSQPRVSRIVNGKAQVEEVEVVERIADGLRIPGRMVGLAPRPWEAAAVTEPDEPRRPERLRVPAHLRDKAGTHADAPAAPRRDEVTDVIRYFRRSPRPGRLAERPVGAAG